MLSPVTSSGCHPRPLFLHIPYLSSGALSLLRVQRPAIFHPLYGGSLTSVSFYSFDVSLFLCLPPLPYLLPLS